MRVHQRQRQVVKTEVPFVGKDLDPCVFCLNLCKFGSYLQDHVVCSGTP